MGSPDNGKVVAVRLDPRGGGRSRNRDDDPLFAYFFLIDQFLPALHSTPSTPMLIKSVLARYETIRKTEEARKGWMNARKIYRETVLFSRARGCSRKAYATRIPLETHSFRKEEHATLGAILPHAPEIRCFAMPG